MMLTMNKLFNKLRINGKQHYKQFLFCTTLSILLIASFALMLQTSMVQTTLPEGGDSRKQVWMLFAIAVVGCFLFILYATGLFLKYKSREIGVFLVLGAKKSELTKALLVEISKLTLGCIAVGMVLGAIISFAIYQFFSIAIMGERGIILDFSLEGVGIGLGFSVLVYVAIVIQAAIFMKRTNLMEILNEQRTSEPLRPVTKKHFASGIILLIFGLGFGYGGPAVLALFGKLMPGIWNLFYLLSAVGMYRIITYLIAHSERGKNPQKYYRNIIASNMMKFQGRQTVRNMSVCTLLLAAALFAAFYPPQLMTASDAFQKSPIDYALHYKMDENEVDKEDLYRLAEQYDVTITQYDEVVFSELLGSGTERDWDDDGNLIEDYHEKYIYSDFIDVSTYNQLTGANLLLENGSYYLVIAPDMTEGYFEKFDDLDRVTNPVNGDMIEVTFAGTTEYQPFVNNGNSRYVLSDQDYAAMSANLPAGRQMKQILFNVEDLDASYEFSKAVYQDYLSRASDAMAVMGEYDEYQEQQATAAGKTYSNGEPMDLEKLGSGQEMMTYWKYYPSFKVLIGKTFGINFAIFFLVFIYVSVICLAAVGIISYTRSVTIGLTNKQLFDDLRKLGANNQYITKTMTGQMKKIFVIPTIIAAVLIYLFTLVIFVGNDGFLASTERNALVIDAGICVLICVYQFTIYRISLKKVKNIIGIPEKKQVV